MVIIASAELTHPIGDNLLDKAGRAFTILFIGKGTPMIPVDAIKISFGSTESFCESLEAKDLQSSIPFGPVQALSFPLLTTIARNLFELFRISRHQVMVGETTWFDVNRPAATEGSSEKIRARSFCLLVFIPQKIPAVVNPGIRNPRPTVSFFIVNISRGKCQGN